MTTQPEKILVVEDEPRYARVITINLETNGYTTMTASDGETAIKMTASKNPDLIILDLMMPGMDGYETCRRIREFSNVPIIILTALCDTNDKIHGLEIGADDYITKPFSARELLARVQAMLRRVTLTEIPPQPVVEYGHLKMDFASQRIHVHDEEIKLTRTEYDLLSVLVKNEGRVLTPEYLLEAVWGMGHEGEQQLLWQAIHRLRKKIEPDPTNPIYIHTRPGVGYVFEYIGVSD